MKKIVRKIFFVWDYDKEEAWLNAMSAKGLQLHSVGFCSYTFNEGVPSEYNYRLEMLKHYPRHPESTQYIRFIEDTGAEHIGTLFRWVYFRKKSDEGGFDIFSDLSSRIKHLNRILFLLGIITVLNAFNGLNMIRLWHLSAHVSSLAIPIICFAFSLIGGYGYYRINRKRRKLVKESTLRE